MERDQSFLPVKFTVQLTEEDNNHIYQLAVRNDLTPGQFARYAIRKYITEVLTREANPEDRG